MSDWFTTANATAGYRLGDRIELHDLLALPPDGERYTRDRRGRLVLMAPDDSLRHRRPLGLLARRLYRALDERWEILQEPGIAFAPILGLRTRRRLPRSRLGRKSLIPDFAVFEGRAQLVGAQEGDAAAAAGDRQLFTPQGLRLVIEVLSRDTHRQDLGLGRADRVDRWRTYLANGVAEYWLLNAGLERSPLPPSSGLFLRNDGARWVPLPSVGAERAPEGVAVRGLRPVVSGRIASAAVPGWTLDLDALWADLAER